MGPGALGAIIGGGLGIGKNIADQNRRGREEHFQEQATALYPWLHMVFGGDSNAGIEKVAKPELVGGVLPAAAAGAVGGFDAGQGVQAAQDQDKYKSAWLAMANNKGGA